MNLPPRLVTTLLLSTGWTFAQITPAAPTPEKNADESRGPNSVLFGIGPAGGIVNSTTKRASLSHPAVETNLQVGNYRHFYGSLERRGQHPPRLARLHRGECHRSRRSFLRLRTVARQPKAQGKHFWQLHASRYPPQGPRPRRRPLPEPDRRGIEQSEPDSPRQRSAALRRHGALSRALRAVRPPHRGSLQINVRNLLNERDPQILRYTGNGLTIDRVNLQTPREVIFSFTAKL